MTDELTDGHWVTVGAVREWQPDNPADVTRKRYRALLAERYAPPEWWTRHPDPTDTDNPFTCRRRLADAVADFDRFDARTPRPRKVA